MPTEVTTGRASESQHWYDRQGRPCYEIRGAKDSLRPVTLRDARKLDLVPGVSSITAMEAKPQLTNWLIEQAVMSALTLPRLPNETLDEFKARAKEDAQEQTRKAAARGTSVHAALQGSFEGKPTAAEDLPYVSAVHAWIGQRYGLQQWQAEQSFASPHGYGGKVDLHSHGVVIDFKGKDFDESKQGKDLAWPDNCMQLAAYRYGLGLGHADCVNIFFSRTVPGLITVREWDEEEIQDGWQCFLNLLDLWKRRKKYNPTFERRAA